MKPIVICIIAASTILIFSCEKSSVSPAPDNSNSNGVRPTPKDTSYITVNIDGQPMTVTHITYNRGSATFNFTAENETQKLDARCFYFYGTSGLNYQYSDSINYSIRRNALSSWSTVRAINWGDVYFDCCEGPLQDKVISGNYSGNFPTGETYLKIDGIFHLIF